ncbi:hypothetical protein FGG78_19370 [Thioclava sp. BHET1]|nr:hypothetical protein FGG78_19370 [Thioclava sp. BHET1]
MRRHRRSCATLLLLATMLAGEMGRADIAAPIFDATEREDPPPGQRLRLDIGSSLRSESLRQTETAERRSTRRLDARGDLLLSDVSSLSQFQLGLHGVLRLKGATEDQRSAMGDQGIRLRYRREVRNADLSFAFARSRAPLAFLDPLTLNQPIGTDSAASRGSRQTRRDRLAFETGKIRPLGLRVRAERDGVGYSGTAKGTAFDHARQQLSATGILRLSPSLEGALELRSDRFHSTDPARGDARIRQTSARMTRQLSSGRKLSVALGFGRLRQSAHPSGDRGAILAEIAVSRAQRRGEVELSYRRDMGLSGPRDEIRLERRSTAAQGLEIAIGATRAMTGKLKLIGAIDLFVPLGQDTLHLTAKRAVDSTASDGDALWTRLRLSYDHPINRRLRMTAQIEALSRADPGGGGPAAQRWQRLRMGLDQRLAQDWTLTSGYEALRSTGSVTQKRHSIFVTLLRRFTLRP